MILQFWFLCLCGSKTRPISISELYYSTSSSQADGIICRLVSFTNSPRREPPTFLRRLPPRFDLRLSLVSSRRSLYTYPSRVCLSFPSSCFSTDRLPNIRSIALPSSASRESRRGREPEGFANSATPNSFSLASFPFPSLSTNFEIREFVAFAPARVNG